MNIAIGLIVVVIVLAVYLFVIRKPPSEPALPEAKDPEDREAKRFTPRSEPPKNKLSAPKDTKAPPKQPSQRDGALETGTTKPSAPTKAQASEHEVKKEQLETQDAVAPDVEIGVDTDDDEQVEPELAHVVAHKPDVATVRKGLERSREKEGFFGRLAKLITGKKDIDPAIVDEIEEVLITSDVGVKTTGMILERLRNGLKNNELRDADAVWSLLRQEAIKILDVGKGGIVVGHGPTVVLMVGVNGSGKTTTIGKIATQFKQHGKHVTLAAGDTFRAAAVQQLAVWGDRVGCDVVKGKDGADPGAVIFDAIRHAEENGSDLVLADTAGRLHTNTNLMDELKKVVRTMDKAMSGAPHEILLVIDATNGQNALVQSRQFADALPLTGIVLTKLDGTAKGGMILGICDELGVPVRYIGLGEKSDDLRPFDAREFVEALLGSAQNGETEAA